MSECRQRVAARGGGGMETRKFAETRGSAPPYGSGPPEYLSDFKTDGEGGHLAAGALLCLIQKPRPQRPVVPMLSESAASPGPGTTRQITLADRLNTSGSGSLGFG